MKKIIFIAFMLLSIAAIGQKQTINALESGAIVRGKLNSMFTELYSKTVYMQFSSAGTSWHTIFDPSDNYFRVSYDQGNTWGDAVPIASENMVLSTLQADTLFIQGDTIVGNLVTFADSSLFATKFDINQIAVIGDSVFRKIIVADTIVFKSNTLNAISTGTSDNNSLVTKGYVDDVVTASGSYNDEAAQDATGAMVTGNTETGIAVTYDDATAKLNFVVASQTDNNFTNTLKTKLDGIAEGAEVNVNADWNASSGDAQILNKPTIPTASNAVYDASAWNDNLDVPTKNAVRDKLETLTGLSHDSITIGTANGLTKAGKQVLSLSLASGSTTGALSSTDWNTFNNKIGTEVDGSTTNEIQNLTNSKSGNKITLNISGGTGTAFYVSDGDSSVTNEIQNLSVSKAGNKITLNISGGTGTAFYVSDGDSSVTNEIQNVSYTAATGAVAISGGGTGFTLPAFSTAASTPGIVPGSSGGGSSVFLNGSGAWSTPSGAGNVSKVGTPVNDQVGVWTGDGTIEGDVDITFDGNKLTTKQLYISTPTAGASDYDRFLVLDVTGTEVKYRTGAQVASDIGALTAEVDGSTTNEIELPTQTGNSGKYLTTNGSAVSWDTPTLAEVDGSVTNEKNTSATYNQSTKIFSITDPQGSVSDTIPTFTSALPGLVGASGGGTSNFLRADGTWSAPAGTTYSEGQGVDITGTTVKMDISSITTESTPADDIYQFLPWYYSTGNTHNKVSVANLSAAAYWNADKLQGVNISSSTPTDGQLLKYVSANNRWEPSSASSGGSLFTDAGTYTYLTSTSDFLSIGTNIEPLVNTALNAEQTASNYWTGNFYNSGGGYGLRIRAGNTSSSTVNALDISDYSNSYGILKAAGNGKITFPRYGSGSFTGTAAKWLAVTSSGEVIEQNAPSGGGGLSGGSAGKVAYWTASDALSYNSNFVWDNTNSRLGIGLSSPSYALHVNTNAKIGSIANDRQKLYFGDGTYCFVGEDGADDRLTIRGTTVAINVNGTGGLSGQVLTSNGTTASWESPAYGPAGAGSEIQYRAGAVMGAITGSSVSSNNITLTGTVTASNFILSSDYRLKENVSPVYDVGWTDNICFVRYNMKGNDNLRYGVIAQQVRQVKPEMVHVDKNGYYTVSLLDIMVAKAARQDEKIKSLEERLTKLEKLINEK